MRTARTLFASAVITAMFAVTAPAATAMSAVEGHTTDHVASSSDHDHDRCKHGHHKRDHRKKDHRKKNHHKRDHHKRDHHWRDHHRPSGGVHTGGGALADLLR
ncbi:hypothetical protein [Streptomyces tubercidicus]|uniref:hypothetical protein n=1 Tax=Streptomyces tubercidicus TaxID=47759 RepID=UPI002E0E9D13|nr:hypothetical protein OG761_35320 [Streptomyces tubercidicus]